MVEQNETFFLELALPVAIPGVTLGSARMATGTITDSTGRNILYSAVSYCCLICSTSIISTEQL